ncbi:DUF4260 domain-containing protein [Oleiharenicola sp. Vm1]|uniref:DUF4260 domain-containing protein n=1 Tax=Oleiharenicola sp. Vm1 TaxID=3398393 RepID=UPI0039F4607F
MDTSFARVWLRLEGLTVLLLAALLYRHFDLPWLWFAVFFLAPDLSLLGYLAGPRAGAWSYNLAHSYAGAGLLVAAGLLAPRDGPAAAALLAAGLIAAAHIGFDRALGYGLKSPAGFRFTHLGRIGRDR